MSSKLHLFENMEFGSIRAMEIDGQPWFVGKDIANAMGYTNESKAIQAHVEYEDRIIMMIPHAQNGSMVSKSLIINESGLYSLIISSKLPSARKFKHWVTSEVLPSIRQHGAYIEEQKLRELLGEAEDANRLFQKLLKKTIGCRKPGDALNRRVEAQDCLKRGILDSNVHLQRTTLIPVSTM